MMSIPLPKLIEIARRLQASGLATHPEVQDAIDALQTLSQEQSTLGKFVVVRTQSAGVHVGTLTAHSGREVTLTDARRIWRWRGANTLSELSQHGAAQRWTRISEPVPEIILTEAIEIIPCSDAARGNLSQSRWAK